METSRVKGNVPSAVLLVFQGSRAPPSEAVVKRGVSRGVGVL